MGSRLTRRVVRRMELTERPSSRADEMAQAARQLPRLVKLWDVID